MLVVLLIILLLALLGGGVWWWKFRDDETTIAAAGGSVNRTGTPETTVAAPVEKSSVVDVLGDLVIMLVGDSLTAGISKVGTTYREHLNRMLDDKNVSHTMVGNAASSVDDGRLPG